MSSESLQTKINTWSIGTDENKDPAWQRDACKRTLQHFENGRTVAGVSHHRDWRCAGNCGRINGPTTYRGNFGGPVYTECWHAKGNELGCSARKLPTCFPSVTWQNGKNDTITCNLCHAEVMKGRPLPAARTPCQGGCGRIDKKLNYRPSFDANMCAACFVKPCNETGCSRCEDWQERKIDWRPEGEEILCQRCYREAREDPEKKRRRNIICQGAYDRAGKQLFFRPFFQPEMCGDCWLRKCYERSCSRCDDWQERAVDWRTEGEEFISSRCLPEAKDPGKQKRRKPPCQGGCSQSGKQVIFREPFQAEMCKECWDKKCTERVCSRCQDWRTRKPARWYSWGQDILCKVCYYRKD